jgi:hypothetical protein
VPNVPAQSVPWIDSGLRSVGRVGSNPVGIDRFDVCELLNRNGRDDGGTRSSSPSRERVRLQAISRHPIAGQGFPLKSSSA